MSYTANSLPCSPNGSSMRLVLALWHCVSGQFNLINGLRWPNGHSTQVRRTMDWLETVGRVR
ncbi:hypothetical protein BJ928_10742 [Rhizobium sp. WW_1]|nr:hypothetical protein BJ928_10742 [Rhizobium sp. WW_1]